MGFVRTNAAAAMLGVSPNTLRSWERRFGYPEPRRTAGGHRQFELSEIEALRSASASSKRPKADRNLAGVAGPAPRSRAIETAEETLWVCSKAERSASISLNSNCR